MASTNQYSITNIWTLVWKGPTINPLSVELLNCQGGTAYLAINTAMPVINVGHIKKAGDGLIKEVTLLDGESLYARVAEEETANATLIITGG